MKKRRIIILAVLLPILVFVISFSLFELHKRFTSDISHCLDQQTLNLHSDISDITRDLCITTYTKGNTSIHIEFSTDTLSKENLILKGWISTNSDTYKKDKYTLTLSDTIITIVEEISQTNTDTETDTTLPQPIVPEIPQSSTYTVTSKEISKINTTENVVVFTFDGGSGTQSLDGILSILTKYSLKGTFFLTGKWAETNINDVKRINNAGHEIFNHTYSHPDLATISDAKIQDEFTKTENIISAITGKSTKPFFRPPYGSRNLHIRESAASLGYQDVYWTIDALDWKESTGTTAEIVKSRILNNLAPGNIYLMHIGDNLTGLVLEDVILEIQSRGYSIMSLYTALMTYN